MNQILEVPLGACITPWLNAGRLNLVTKEQAIAALKKITSIDSLVQSGTTRSWADVLHQSPSFHATFSLPIPGDPCGTPAEILPVIELNSGVIAISRDEVIYADHELRWHIIQTSHGIVPLNVSEARRMFLSRMTYAEKALSELHSIGDSSVAEQIMRCRTVTYLPPSFSATAEAAIEQALSVRALASFGIMASQVIASRSGDNSRVRILRELEHSARLYLCAAASTR